MRDQRKKMRYPTNIELTVETLYKQDYIEISNVNKDIVLTDISRSGLGFSCSYELPLNYYFNAKIKLDEKRYFHCVIKIIRRMQREGAYHYGCEFVGLADVLSIMIEEYGAEFDF